MPHFRSVQDSSVRKQFFFHWVLVVITNSGDMPLPYWGSTGVQFVFGSQCLPRLISKLCHSSIMAAILKRFGDFVEWIFSKCDKVCATFCVL